MINFDAAEMITFVDEIPLPMKVMSFEIMSLLYS